MHQGTTDRHATLVRGFAWHIYPDPATPGVFEGDVPFAVGNAPGPGRPPYDPESAGAPEKSTTHSLQPALASTASSESAGGETIS